MNQTHTQTQSQGFRACFVQRTLMETWNYQNNSKFSFIVLIQKRREEQMSALISEQPVDVSTVFNLASGASTRGGPGKPARSPGQGQDPAPVHHTTILSPAVTIKEQSPSLSLQQHWLVWCATTWAQGILSPIEKKKEVNWCWAEPWPVPNALLLPSSWLIIQSRIRKENIFN